MSWHNDRVAGIEAAEHNGEVLDLPWPKSVVVEPGPAHLEDRMLIARGRDMQTGQDRPRHQWATRKLDPSVPMLGRQLVARLREAIDLRWEALAADRM